MTLQSVVRFDQAFGVPGEIIYDGPLRVEPGVINSASAANNVFGRVFTKDGTTFKWRAGNADGLGVATGILVNPKEYAAVGTVAGGTLAPTLAIPNETNAAFMTMGFVTAVTLLAAKQGYEVRYAKADGQISCVPVGTAADPLMLTLATGSVKRVDQPNVPGMFALGMTQ